MKKSLMSLAVMLLAGCGGHASRPAAPQKIGTPNPASVYCVQQGGKVEMEKSPEGVISYCHLPDGTRVEEWTLFRQNNAKKP